MSSVIDISDKSDYLEFKKHKRCIIFYGAKWCKGCREIQGLYERIANRYQKRIKMAHVDIDDAGLDFEAVPVFVTFYNGNVLNSMEGANVKGLKNLIKEVIEAK